MNTSKEGTAPPKFYRVLEGDREIVDYYRDSSIRIWRNTETDNYPTHWHPALEIIMPLENDYTVNSSQAAWQLKPGDILIIPDGELHELTAPPTGIRLIYLIDFSALSKIKSFSALLPFRGGEPPILINRETCPAIYEEERRLMLEICEEFYSGRELMEPYIYSLLITFFVNLGREKIRHEAEQTPYLYQNRRQKNLQNKLNTLFDYLDTHYTEDISLDDAADLAGFSKFHFSRLFKQCSGQNLNDYLCFRRIKAVETLLLEPDITITDIALQTGFSSISTFNRTFKKVKNCTPSEYRAFYQHDLSQRP